MNENQIMETENQENKIDLQSLIDIVWKTVCRYYWLILLLTSIGSLYYWGRAKQSYVPYYRAQATCTISGAAAGNDTAYYTMARGMASLSPYLLSSRTLQQMIAEDCGGRVMGSSSVSVMENSNLLTISTISPDPQMAYDILLSTINNFPKVAEYVMGTTSLHIISPPSVPTQAYNQPDYKSAAFRGAIYGFAASVLIIVLISLLRKTVRSEGDIEKKVNCKCIATVPQITFKKRKKVKEMPISILDKNTGYGFTETYRSIRTKVKAYCRENDAKIILVSSAIPGEGKTTTAVNLALSLVSDNKNVILVDADLRKPSIHSMLKLKEDTPGINDVLKGKASLDQALYDYPVRKKVLKVLSGRESAEDAAEKMGSDEMGNLIAELRKTADYIIVDTPPCAVMSDTVLLSRFADGILFVVRYDYAKQTHVIQALENVAVSGIPLVGCVLNGREGSLTEYIASYHYGSYGKYGKYGRYGRYGKYGSSYGYGYGSKENEKEQIR